MIREIIIYPNPILQTRSEKISAQDTWWNLRQDLWDTCKHNNGLGLSAPQIGVNERCFIFQGVFCVDPKILHKSSATSVEEEGCLSIPGKVYAVERSGFIRVEYLTKENTKIEQKLSGQLARIFAHELDHLDGILICDIGKEIK